MGLCSIYTFPWEGHFRAWSWILPRNQSQELGRMYSLKERQGEE